MKKNILALAIPALLVGGAAAHADVTIANVNGVNLTTYGDVKLEASKLGKDAPRDYYFKDTIGLKGETAVSPSVKVFGGVEVERNGGNNVNPTFQTPSKGFVGISHAKFGTIEFGKDGLASDQYTDLVDVFEAETISAPLFGTTDADFNTIEYTNSIAGFDVAADYTDVKGAQSSHVSAGYNLDVRGVNLHPVVAVENVNGVSRTFGLGTGVTFGGLYTAFNFNHTTLKASDDATNGVDFLAQYTYKDLTVRGALAHVKTEDQKATNTMKFEADYALNGHANVYAGYEKTVHSDDAIYTTGLKLSW